MKKKSTAFILPGYFTCRFFFLFLGFIICCSSLVAQTVKVTGTVRDHRGVSIPSVTITVKGSSAIATTSDNTGAFSINVPSEKSELIFTSIGYNSKTVTVLPNVPMNIVLTDKANDLEEVVVIGYGQTVKKRDLTGSISSVTSKQIAERQPINLFDALQGQAAGVLIMNDNGEPGAQGSIQIRGTSTFVTDGNTPLYVVDGVITDNAAGINPADIEKIEVLKDASSTAIYG